MKHFIERKFAQLLLWMSGWKLEGAVPDLRKCVIIGAPHTSNWDFFFGLLYKMYYGLNIHFLMKKELFRFPLNLFFRLMRGIPVDRTQHDNLVERLGKTMKNSDSFYLAIAPEGTRKMVKIWKRGFYHIAKKAGVPIVLAYMDYNRHVVGVGPVIYTSNNIEHDMEVISAFYSSISAKFPDRFCLPV